MSGSQPETKGGSRMGDADELLAQARYIYWQYMEASAAAKGDTVAIGEKEKCLRGDLDHQHGVKIALAACRQGERYRLALEAIQNAVIDGKVCDDVAWFSNIETLHDFIAEVLHPSQPAAMADLFGEG